MRVRTKSSDSRGDGSVQEDSNSAEKRSHMRNEVIRAWLEHEGVVEWVQRENLKEISRREKWIYYGNDEE